MDKKTEASHPYFLKGYSVETFNPRAFVYVLGVIAIAVYMLIGINSSFKGNPAAINAAATIHAQAAQKQTAVFIRMTPIVILPENTKAP